MGINVAFDIVDNTDDLEPAQIGVTRQQEQEMSLEDQQASPVAGVSIRSPRRNLKIKKVPSQE